LHAPERPNGLKLKSAFQDRDESLPNQTVIVLPLGPESTMGKGEAKAITVRVAIRRDHAHIQFSIQISQPDEKE
jgi:hypothetical protein